MADITIEIVKSCRVRGRDRQPGDVVQLPVLPGKALIAQGKARERVTPSLRVKLLRSWKGHEPGHVLDLPMATAQEMERAGLCTRHSAKATRHSAKATRPSADKALRGAPENKDAPAPAPAAPTGRQLAEYTEVELGAEFERRTQRPFVSTFDTADLLDELQRRGAANPTEEAHDPIEVVSVALPSLAEVKAKRGKFDAHAADLRLVGVKGRSWAQLAEDYEEWINGLLAPLSETVEGSDAPAPEGDA